MEGQNKYAKTTEFEVLRHIKVLEFQKVKGAKYADKWGNTNQLTFLDEQGQQKVYDNPSFFFLKDFKDAGIKSGDECLVLSIKMEDPRGNMEKSYRRWIFQRLSNERNTTNNQRSEGQEDGGTTAPTGSSPEREQGSGDTPQGISHGEQEEAPRY